MTPSDGFVATTGMSIRGEIGWHQHGSGENIDIDIDMAIILETTGSFASSDVYNLFWALTMDVSEQLD